MKNKAVRRSLQILSVGLTLLTFVFAYGYGRTLLADVDFTQLNAVWLVLSGVGFILFYGCFSFHWAKIARLIDATASPLQPLAFCASQPYKYLPTSIFTFSFRAKYAKELGMSVKNSSYAQLLENINILASGIFVAATGALLYVHILSGVLLMVFVLFLSLIIWRQKFVWRAPYFKRIIPIYKMIPVIGIMILAWLCGGLAFWAANAALGFSPDVRLAIAANAAGYVASILAFFAPGGIGVREWVLATFSIASMPILLWRMITFIGDVVIGFSAIVVIKRVK
ncbi:hypothetical protein E6P97_03205 [Patescibacteria group bacterium]|nr:MAG: hypothetical protein E6P97_03205 [Patescibacteria group bacterium]